MIRKALVLTIAAGVLAVAGCTAENPADELVVGSAAARFPSQGIADWVSYADHVAYFTVLDERELPWGEHEQTYGEGMVGREVTLQFELILWSRDGAPELARELVVSTFGWALKENERTPFTVQGSPRLEVGDRYLTPWVHTSADGWLPQADTAILQVDGSLRAQRHTLNRDSPHDEAINTFVGKSPEEILDILEVTLPDPVAEKYLYLRPQERYKAVVLETEMPDRPGFLKAATEGSIYDAQLGYVRREDWDALEEAKDANSGIPLFDEDGARLGTVTRNDLVLSV